MKCGTEKLNEKVPQGQVSLEEVSRVEGSVKTEEGARRHCRSAQVLGALQRWMEGTVKGSCSELYFPGSGYGE